jgi:hypothetical protein
VFEAGHQNALTVPPIDGVIDFLIDLPFCGKDMTEGIQRVVERRETLYRYANRLEEGGGLKELD